MDSLIFNGITIDEFFIRVKEIVTETIKEEKSTAFSNQRIIKYLTRFEVAQRLNVSLPTLHEYTKQGFLPAYRLGSRVLYKESDIDNAIQKRQLKYQLKK
jgi:excisionase family DNA binding protein